MADFLDVRLAKITKEQYMLRLKTFFDSLSLHGSLDKQSRDFLVKVKKDGGREWAQNGLKYFIRAKKKKVEEGQLAEATIRNFYKPVRLFCNIHDIELSWKKITNMIPTGRTFADDRAPTHDEIGKIIKYDDKRIKPVVLTSCSSGIRIGAWEYLRWKHIEPIERGGKIIAAKITVYAGENDQYYSFITPEAYEALVEWMEFRRISGENINGESWLMRTVWNTRTTKKNRLGTTTIKSPKKMSRGAIKMMVIRALKIEGVRSKTDIANISNIEYSRRRYDFKTNHGFRKFFQTNTEPKMKSLHVKTLMGQDTGLAASYYKPTTEELLEEYLKAVDNLTIDKNRNSRTEMEKVSENQQILVREIQSKDYEMKQLKKQMSQMSSEMKFFRNQFNAYQEIFGPRPLTKSERTRLEEFQEQIEKLPPDNNTIEG